MNKHFDRFDSRAKQDSESCLWISIFDRFKPPVALAVVPSKAAVLLFLICCFKIVTPIVGFCNLSMFCCALLCVHSSFAIISMGKRQLVALVCLSSWCLLIVVWLFLTMPRVCLHF